MFPHPDLGDLRSNGPIVNMPNWQALSSPLPVPPDHKSTPAEHGRVAEDSPWQGESKTACAGTPSPSPLPKGDCSEAASADDPQSLSSLLPLPPGESRGEGALNFEPRHHPKAGPPYPALGGRPKALDDDKQSTVCNLVAAGVSLRQAARYVDCDPNSIRREARRNGEFRRQLAKARSEASIHPLSTLRQAAKTNWRAALCWMERLDPERFARPDSSIITKRESNQFVADLVESIERAVSDAGERSNLYELLSAAMPAAMRRHWDGHGSRRNLKQAMRDFDKKKYDELERRAKRRREFTARIASYLPWQLIRELSDYHDVLDPQVIHADRAHLAARRNPVPDQPHDDCAAEGTPLNEAPLNDGPTASLMAENGNHGQTKNASPRGVFVTPPRRNPDGFASPPLANVQPANDLQQPGEAKLAE